MGPVGQYRVSRGDRKVSPSWDRRLRAPERTEPAVRQSRSTRPEVVRVRAQDRNGDFFEVEDSDLTARCFCHEIEHLDGHLFVEHTDHLMTEEELEEFIRRQEEDEA